MTAVEVIALLDGRALQVHAQAVCRDEWCCIHKPSDHPLKDAPLDWCPVQRVMFRLCRHGYGHPDPDDLKVRTWPNEGRHTCDGCCEMRSDVPGLVGCPR